MSDKTDENNPGKSIEYIKTLYLANRKWEIRYTPTPDYITGRRSWQPWGVLLGGLLLTELLATYLGISLNRTKQIERLVRDRTKDLLKSNEILAKEIVVRIQAEEALQKAHDALDSQVRERTGELSESNEQLRQEIHERRQIEEAMRRSEEAAMRMAQENALIAEMGRIISSSLNIEEVYDRFVKEVRKLIFFDRISINIIDYEKKCFTVPYVIGPEVAGRLRGQTIPLSGTAMEEVVQIRSSLLIQKNDEKELVGRLPGLHPVFESGLQSLMLIPLIYKDKVIGGLNVLSTQPEIYTDKDLRVAERVAQQIAGAIANARLFNERKRAEEALRKSEREAQRLAYENSILAEISRIISSTLSIEETYKLFCEEVRKLIAFDLITISLIDACKDIVINQYVEGTPAPGRSRGESLPMEGTTTSAVIKSRKGLMINVQDEKEVEQEFSVLLPELQLGLRSFLSVPLISGDQVVGALHLRSKKYKAYSEQDLKLSESIANQIAGAIAKVQIFDELKRTAEALGEVEQRNGILVEAVGQAGEGMVILRNAGHDEAHCIFANEQAQKILGYTEEELLYLSWKDLVHPPLWKAVIDRYRRRMGGEAISGLFEITVRNKNRQAVPIEITGTLTRIRGESVLVGFFRDITNRKRAEEEIEKLLQSVNEKREELRALGARLALVEEEERRRVARELHDRVGQNLTALGINLNILRAQLPAEGATKIGRALEESLRLIAETMADIRNLMSELHPPLMDEYGLLAALRWYGEQFSERTGVATAIRGDDRMQRLSSSKEIALFRIAQEALTNVAKHARASHVTVTLERVDEGTVMSLADDGVGFDNRGYPSQGKPASWGLITIRERAEAIGGQAKIESEPGKGTRIIVEVGG